MVAKIGDHEGDSQGKFRISLKWSMKLQKE